MKKWIFCLILIVTGSKIWAQGCSLCSLNAQSIGDNAGAGLNQGIIYLAAVPFLFVTTVGIIWYRRNHRSQEGE